MRYSCTCRQTKSFDGHLVLSVLHHTPGLARQPQVGGLGVDAAVLGPSGEWVLSLGLDRHTADLGMLKKKTRNMGEQNILGSQSLSILHLFPYFTYLQLTHAFDASLSLCVV